MNILFFIFASKRVYNIRAKLSGVYTKIFSRKSFGLFLGKYSEQYVAEFFPEISRVQTHFTTGIEIAEFLCANILSNNQMWKFHITEMKSRRFKVFFGVLYMSWRQIESCKRNTHEKGSIATRCFFLCILGNSVACLLRHSCVFILCSFLLSTKT